MSDRTIKEHFIISTKGGGIASKPFDHYPTPDEIRAFIEQIPNIKVYVQVEKMFSLEYVTEYLQVEERTAHKEGLQNMIDERTDKERMLDGTFKVIQALEVKLGEYHRLKVAHPPFILMTYKQGRLLAHDMPLGVRLPKDYKGIKIIYTDTSIGDEPLVCW